MDNITDIEIVATVEGANVIPEGWPEIHPLYKRDPNSWVYLTPKGQEIYKQYKAEVDLLIFTLIDPKLEKWAKESVKKVLSL